jgi:exodeoxyribonuclease VII large subunit
MPADFFEFHEQAVARPRREPTPSSPANVALSVTELTLQLDQLVRSGFPDSLLVRGELSNFQRHGASGHLYFTLKDSQNCVECVMWKSDAVRMKFAPADGMELVASGRIAVYGKRGRYQLYATALHPIGQGALELAFRQMRAKLEREGLFAAERKRPLPNYPRTLVLISSREGAALQDMLKVIGRFPFLRVRLFAVPVQGDGAAQRIAAALGSVRADDGDLVLLARGGGSLEDLWAFNEEIVARAVAQCALPVITGIGHEVDVSIADLVADFHAHTPTEAAQVATAAWRGATELLANQSRRLLRVLQAGVANARRRLAALERHEVFRRPLDRLNQHRQYLDDRQRALVMVMRERMRTVEQRLAVASARLSERHPRWLIQLRAQQTQTAEENLARTLRTALKQRQSRVDALEARLKSLGVESVLRRGYSILTIKRSGLIVRSIQQVKPGDRLVTRLADGSVQSVAEDAAQLPLFE